MRNKNFISNLLIMFLVILFTGSVQASSTIATFADPSKNSDNWLFTVDLNSDTITGGWADDKAGLTLEVPYSGNTFVDAFFTMTDVSYTGGLGGGTTDGGTIRFFDDDQDTSTTPLVRIYFESTQISPLHFGATNIGFSTANGVEISGSEINGTLTDQATFSFSFANHAKLEGSSSYEDGFTATAAFTSSAVPEPATIAILGLGSLSLMIPVRRKRKT